MFGRFVISGVPKIGNIATTSEKTSMLMELSQLSPAQTNKITRPGSDSENGLF